MGGRIDSPFRFFLAEIEEAPLGPVVLTVHRGRRRLEITVDGGGWEVEVFPILPRSEAARAEEARALEGKGEAATASQIWAELAKAARGSQRPEGASWYLTRLGAASIAAGDLDGSAAAFQGARARISDASLETVVFDLEGLALEDNGRYRESQQACRISLRRRDATPDSAELAWSLFRAGRASYYNRDIQGVKLAERSSAIYRSLPSARFELGRAKSLLANFAYATGKLDRAEAFYREALELFQSIAPHGRQTATVLTNLGLVAHDHGRLAEAEELYRRGLAIEEKLEPGGFDTAHALNNLGIVAKNKGDLEAARIYYEKALRLFAERRPGGTEEAGLVNNLGNLALRQGALEAAERYHRRALELREQRLPNGLDAASSLHNLGSTLRRDGRLEQASSFFERALKIKQELLPDSHLLSNTLYELGEVARGREELLEAASLHEQALAIRRRVAPQSTWTAESLFALGSVAVEGGRRDQAESYWRQALGILARQRGRLRLEPEGSSRFLAPFHADLHRLAVLLVETGRQREALDLLESSRARALRIMMRLRGDVASEQLPPELAAERYRLESSLDRTESRLARLSATEDAERIAALQERIRELKLDLDGLRDRIQRAAPRLAAFNDPEPLVFEQVSEALDPGILLLSYSVGPDSTLLFVTTAADGPTAPLRVYELPVGEPELRRRVEVFRSLIRRGRWTPEIESALVTQGSRLYRLLLAPAAEAITHAERLLLVADGPLLTLPFGVLIRSVEPLEFLAAWKPLAFVPSGSVLAELATNRPPPKSEPRLAAFGEPATSRESKSAMRPLVWAPLPHAEREIRRISALFDGRARVFLGADATEENVKMAASRADYLHFAGHAYVRPRFPLDSALVLSRSTGSNTEDETGVLHAWEIISELRTDADLVTLSACETALGGELAGEGLIGLARAFQYAGARSLLVSQWPVSDRSTGELMVRFYGNLKRGLSKSDALRAAQSELMAAPVGAPDDDEGTPIDARHPYFWGAFQIVGDWR